MIFLVAGLVFIIDGYEFANKINDFLYQRPLLLKGVYQRKMQMTLFCFYALDYNLQSTNYSLQHIYPEFYGLSDSKDSIARISSAITISRRLVKEPQSMAIMTDQVQQEMFNHLDGVSTFLTTGIFFACGFLVQECNFVAFGNGAVDLISMNQFFQEVIEFNNQSSMVYKNIDIQSSWIIEAKLDGFIYFAAFSCLLLLFMYAIYFYPFILKEIRIINDAAKLLSILPNPTSIKNSTNCKAKDRKRLINR